MLDERRDRITKEGGDVESRLVGPCHQVVEHQGCFIIVISIISRHALQYLNYLGRVNPWMFG